MEYYYLNYFQELKGWSKEEKLTILVKAKHCAFKEKGLFSKHILYSILIISLGVLIIVPGQVLLTTSPTEQGYIQSIVLSSILFTCGILITIFMYRKMYGKLIHQGLLSVLRDRDS